MQLKFEFDNWEEYEEATKHLEKYHNCEACRGKIVGVYIDELGNTHCSYCNAVVKYPKLKKEVFKKWLKKNEI